jgi:hypothetical protein
MPATGVKRSGPHRVEQNRPKMYDRAAIVLRADRDQQPRRFRVHKEFLQMPGSAPSGWRCARRGLPFRYHEVSLPTNARYLNALAAVDDPTQGAKVGRCFMRLHAHGLIAQIPRTRR